MDFIRQWHDIYLHLVTIYDRQAGYLLAGEMAPYLSNNYTRKIECGPSKPSNFSPSNKTESYPDFPKTTFQFSGFCPVNVLLDGPHARPLRVNYGYSYIYGNFSSGVQHCDGGASQLYLYPSVICFSS